MFAPLVMMLSTASAVEVEFEGSYQLRGRYFNSLSLTDQGDAGVPERAALYAEHRLWLRPKFLLSDRVKLTVDFKGLDNVAWGNQPEFRETFANPVALEEGLSAPTSDTDSTAPLRDFTIWRAWGEVDTDAGRVSFGRMPLHWGMGIWQNDGLSLNAEYGDTADRIQYEALLQDTVFIRAAVDTIAENFINEADDTYAVSLAAAYKSERVVGGLQVHYQRTERDEQSNDLNLVTVDGSLEAEVGKLQLSAEFIGQFGGGDINAQLNDATITAFGGAIDAQLNLDRLGLQVQGGFATGDNDDTNNKLGTFTFDRDYNLGVILFEQPMPVFAQAAPNAINQNRNFDAVELDPSVSNALYLKPTVSYRIIDGFHGKASVLTARSAALPARFANRRGYGTEVMGGFVYNGLKHLEVDARGGVFLPGTYFRNFSSDTIDGFDRPAVGVQLTSRIRF